MPIPFIPTIAGTKSTLNFTYNGSNVQMVLNFKWGAPATSTDRGNLNTALHTFWTNQLKPNIGDNLGLILIDTVNLDSASAPGTQLSLGSPEYGTIAGEDEPANAALVVTHRTGLRGRSYRGRTYVGGLHHYATNSVTSQDASNVTGIVSAFSWLLTAANTANAVWSVLSKFSNLAARAQGVMTPITGLSADTFYDSQRRRLFGRGA
jgi:hypothetical protein